MSLKFQISGFAVVGACATLVQYGLMALLIGQMRQEVVLASTISYALSALFNYALNRRFVFRSQSRHSDALPKFAVTALLGLALNAAFMYLFSRIFTVHWFVIQAITTCIVMISNFLLSKFWVFQQCTLPTRR